MTDTVAFCQRESDLVWMTILHDGDRLVARRRQVGDVIVPTHRTGEFDDIWMHRKSRTQYTRHDHVLDIEMDIACYDYSSWKDGRLWLRSVTEWHEELPDGPRFLRVA